MKKRNLQPTQTAPVERDTAGSSLQGVKGVDPSIVMMNPFNPFAGDDAE